MNTNNQNEEEPYKNIRQRFPELFENEKKPRNLLLKETFFSEELDYKHQSASNMFFNGHAKTRTFIERYEGEAYTHNLKKKVEDKFCLIDKLLGEKGGFKMDNSFKAEIKGIIVQIHGIARRNQEFLRYINPSKEECSFHINLKYLFLSVVYLKLKSDLYENIGVDCFEIGLGELVKVYGSREICMGKLGNYIDFVKAVVREFGFGIKLTISKEEKKELTVCYFDRFLKLSSNLIKGSPNFSEFSEKKLKRVYIKILENFEAKYECIKGKRVRHFACGIFHIALRLLDVNVSLIELVDILRKDQGLRNIVYYSVTRVIREICDEFVDKFIQILLKYKKNKILITSKLGKYSCFLGMYEGRIQELMLQNRINIKSKVINEIMKFCLKGKVLKVMNKLKVCKNLHLKQKRKIEEQKSISLLGKRSRERRDYDEASTAEFFFKEEDRISSLSGYPF